MSRLLKIPKSGLGFGLKFLAQDAGANESDQAIMSIANYPYSFKVCHYVMISLLLRNISLVYLGRFGRWFSFGKNRKTKILACSSIVNFSIFSIILFIPNKRLVINPSNCQTNRFHDVMPSSYCHFGKK